MFLSDWLIFHIRWCEDPKADLKTIIKVCWEDCLVVPLVTRFRKIFQGQGARRDIVGLCLYFSICYCPTFVCFAITLLVAVEMGMAGIATGVNSIGVGEHPPTASRGVSRDIQQGRLTLAEELD